MSRRLNYTSRIRIRRSDARISLQYATNGGPSTFDLSLDLSRYDFPADARVRVEAWRGHAVQRWEVGTVAAHDALSRPQRRLSEVPDSSQFRVAVITTDGSGRILGLADRIRPVLPRRSLLPLREVDDLGDEVWRVSLGTGEDTERPELQVNSSIPGISDLVRMDPSFRALVMPSVLRDILTHMLFVGSGQPDEEDDSLHDWWRFAQRLSPTPDGTSPSGVEEQIRWIDAVVDAFAGSSVKAARTYREIVSKA